MHDPLNTLELHRLHENAGWDAQRARAIGELAAFFVIGQVAIERRLTGDLDDIPWPTP